MAKEMMIVFVYDTYCLKEEGDDPVNAVLYFHPSWVSDSQKLALCGQIMGTSQFLRGTFGRPKVIALQNGKFILKEFGRFILAVGTDRNLALSVLEHRAELLSSLVRLFHRDVQTIYDQFSVSGQFRNISEKLYHIFETYLPILQYNGNIFQNMPKSKLSKSASNIFLEAMHTLQSCQRTKGILGGSVLYHNKIIASQLYSKLAKNLVLTDPYRIRSSTETITVNFHVPVGCQLITVFIPKKEYQKLYENSERIQKAYCQNYTNTNNNSVYPFQFKRKLKRDKSIVFTNIPEECSLILQNSHNGKFDAIDDQGRRNFAFNEQNNITPVNSTACVRPNHLPLRFKTISSGDIPESGFSSSITFDERDSYPQFIGRTSVCSTPMTENKVLQGNILPICIDPLEKLDSEGDRLKSDVCPNRNKTEEEIQNSTRIGNIYKFPEKSFENFIDNTTSDQKRRNSYVDITDTMKPTSRHLSICLIGKNCAKILNDSGSPLRNKHNNILHKCFENCNCSDYTFDYDADLIDDVETRTIYHTIVDPTYPVFNIFGQPISKFLFEEYSKHKCDKINSIITDNNNTNVEEQSCSEVVTINDEAHRKQDIVPQSVMSPNISEAALNNSANRRSLSLPIKSLDLKEDNGYSATNDKPEYLPTKNANFNILERPEQRKRLTGIQLTPLITKLSILAMNDERSSGFSSWDTTPGVETTTPQDSTRLFRRRSSVKMEDVDSIDVNAITNITESDENEMKKVELFVCGQNNMTVLLLMEEGSAEKQELIQAMFDICVLKLPRLEAHLNQILNVNINGDRIDGGYSYLSIDHNWDTLDRAGPWSNTDLISLESVRHEFENDSNLHNFVFRGDDSVIYGHQSIDSSVFYKQPAQFQNGLPPPADAMGTISKHAKRHLERDHSLILF